MNKKELKIFEKKNNIEDKNFLNFLIDYEKIKLEKDKREDINMVVLLEIILLLFGELFIYYKDFDINLKFMTMLMIFGLGIMTFGKEILNLIGNMTSKRAFKEDIKLMEEKTEDWLDILKEKEKKYEIAQGLIRRIEKLENKSKNDDEKKLNEVKVNIYKIFAEDIIEEKFSLILEKVNEIEKLEKDYADKEKEEQNFQKIKSEIDGVRTVKLSDSFIKNGKSFN